MGIPEYVGVENEFRLWRGPFQIDATPFIAKAKRRSKYHVPTGFFGFRTVKGGSVYADGDEAEVCTAPVRIDAGFPTRLANALVLSRQQLADSFQLVNPHAAVTGYSMHMNVSVWDSRALQFHPLLEETVLQCGVPLALLSLNAYSQRVMVRSRDHRYELVTDYVDEPQQVAAAALLFAASVRAMQEKASLPLRVPSRLLKKVVSPKTGCYLDNPVVDGRVSRIEVLDPETSCRTISAQEYLEQHYAAVRPFVEELSSEEERATLEEFISGKRKLESEDKDLFGHVRMGRATPGWKVEKWLVDRQRTINLDAYLHARPGDAGHIAPFLGKLASRHLDDIKVMGMDWESISLMATLPPTAPIVYANIDLRSLPQIDLYAKILEQVPAENLAAGLYEAEKVMRVLEPELRVPMPDLAQMEEIKRAADFFLPRALNEKK